MNKLLASALCVFVLFSAAGPCFADPVNGVLSEERVVRLPQDAGKWYISVVGDANNARYHEIVVWFDTNPSLKKLKNQVHFCPVTTDTGIYKERYAKNVKGLPTVRMQKPDGKVVFEAAGRNLPMTAAGLNGALANSVSAATGCRPILPWRRDMERRCPGPCPNPQPDPEPLPDPEPQPLDDGGTPIVDPEPETEDLPLWGLILLINGGFLVGVALGYGKQLYQKIHPPVK